MMKANMTSMLITGIRLAGLACLVVILNILAQSEIQKAANEWSTGGRLRPRSPRLALTEEMIPATYPADPASAEIEVSPDSDRLPGDGERALGLSTTPYECESDNVDFTGIALQTQPDCKKRLPSVICIGFEKCGTEALSIFLSEHPAIKHAVPFDASFWNRDIDKGVDWYLDHMPVSSTRQVTMEKASSYVFDQSIPERMSLVKPEMKFILMVCDPVARALSEFLHLRDQNRTGLSPEESLRPIVAETFEASVVDNRGNINTNNSIVARGRYEVYLREWLEYFPIEQFLILDGTALRDNPLPVLRQVESFLEIFAYFDARKIGSDAARRFACRTRPTRGCSSTGRAVGRVHPPVIEQEVLAKLRKFYQPYNARLESLTGEKFSWS